MSLQRFSAATIPGDMPKSVKNQWGTLGCHIQGHMIAVARSTGSASSKNQGQTR
jgi:hypothetical protein